MGNTEKIMSNKLQRFRRSYGLQTRQWQTMFATTTTVKSERIAQCCHLVYLNSRNT